MKALLAVVLAACIAIPAAPARAGMLADDGPEAARLRILAALARPEIRQELEARGVSLPAAQARVEALSDAEAIELAARLDSLPAGASAFEDLLLLPAIVVGAYVVGGAGAVVLLVGAAALFAWAAVKITDKLFK